MGQAFAMPAMLDSLSQVQSARKTIVHAAMARLSRGLIAQQAVPAFASPAMLVSLSRMASAFRMCAHVGMECLSQAQLAL